jgi:hypothetical protein
LLSWVPRICDVIKPEWYNGNLFTAAETAFKQADKQHSKGEFDRTCCKVRPLLRSDAC